MSWLTEALMDKKTEIVLFSSTAIALYGYDQGMMSLINTNYNYLETMGISGEDPLVGIIVSVYYLGCAVGAVLASLLADKAGRKPSIFVCLTVTALGNLFMFVSGLGYSKGAMTMMFLGRVIMGLGVGGIDSVIPVYSSELNSDGGRGEALAKEFQSNIFGLVMAFGINLAVTDGLGKDNEWGLLPSIVSMLAKLTSCSLADSHHMHADLSSSSTKVGASPMHGTNQAYHGISASYTGSRKPRDGSSFMGWTMTQKRPWKTYTARRNQVESSMNWLRHTRTNQATLLVTTI